MSNQNPIQTAFEFQRTVLESTQRMTHETLEAQKSGVEAFVNTVDTVEDLNEQNVRMTQDVLHNYLDGVEEMTPTDGDVNFDELHELVEPHSVEVAPADA